MKSPLTFLTRFTGSLYSAPELFVHSTSRYHCFPLQEVGSTKDSTWVVELWGKR